MKIVGIIPSRLESTRLPRKPLVDIEGLPMIVHVYLRSIRAKKLDDVFVATDSQEIADIVSSYGGKYIMTSMNHETGTDRIAEAVTNIDCDIVVNIQGDEALVYPEHIDMAIDVLLNDESVNAALLVVPCIEYNSSSHIKTVVDEGMNVMYFSRSDIPSSARYENAPMLKGYHIVPFRKDFLLEFSGWECGKLESIEYCEYMRILEKGFKIKAAYVDSDAVSVDDCETLAYVRKKMIDDALFLTYQDLAVN